LHGREVRSIVSYREYHEPTDTNGDIARGGHTEYSTSMGQCTTFGRAQSIHLGMFFKTKGVIIEGAGAQYRAV